MIGKKIEEMFFAKQEDLVIDYKNVAVLRTKDQLYHAMLILTNSYNTLPVVDEENRVIAKLSLNDIIRASAESTTYNFDTLLEKEVKDILKPNDFSQNVALLRENASLEEILVSLTDTNFSCVVDENNILKGIITRKEVMGRVNQIFHTLESKYDLLPKEYKIIDQLKENGFDKYFTLPKH